MISFNHSSFVFCLVIDRHDKKKIKFPQTRTTNFAKTYRKFDAFNFSLYRPNEKKFDRSDSYLDFILSNPKKIMYKMSMVRYVLNELIIQREGFANCFTRGDRIVLSELNCYFFFGTLATFTNDIVSKSDSLAANWTLFEARSGSLLCC